MAYAFSQPCHGDNPSFLNLFKKKSDLKHISLQVPAEIVGSLALKVAINYPLFFNFSNVIDDSKESYVNI